MKKLAAVVIATLICASCGGSSGGSSDPPAASTANPPSSTGAPPPTSGPPPPPSQPAPAPPPGSPTYTLVDLGTLGGDVTPHGINDHDDVVGTSKLPGGTVWHAFLYLHDCDCMQDLALSPGELSDAWAITDDDLVSMDSASAANQPSGPAIVWKSGGRTELPSTNPALNQYGTPYAMNSHGLVAGSAWSKANSAHATLWTPHGDSYTATDLGTLEGAAYSRATSVNGDGDVAGISDTKEMGNGCPSGNSDDDRDHAFLYQHGQLQYLGSLSHVMDISQAWGINAAEQIVGGSAFGDCSSNPTAMFHAFLWHHGAMIDLGTLASPSYQSRADAINDSGDIVGYSDVNAQQLEHAFLYTGGKMLDLNSLIDPADPLRPYVTLSEATAINCTGDIAALGWDSRDNSRQHGYLVVREGEDRHDQCTN